MDEQQLAEAKRLVVEQTVTDSLVYVDAAGLPERVLLTDSSFANIGRRFQVTAFELLAQLQVDCDEFVPEVIGLAVKTSLSGASLASSYIRNSIAQGLCISDATAEEASTVEGYVRQEGWANATYNYIHGAESFAEKAALESMVKPDSNNLLILVMEALAVYWFATASAAIGSGSFDEGLDALGEAFEALSLADFDRGWDAGLAHRPISEIGPSEIAALRHKVLSENGLRGSDVAHEVNRRYRKEAFAWLDANADPVDGNMSQAAKALEKIIHRDRRTLYRWALEWKKGRNSG